MGDLSQGMKAGLRDGAVVGMTAGLLGLMYALAALEAGLLPLETVFYSLVVYSAAVQFAALGTDTALGAVLALISGSLFICTRNVLMSLDMALESRGRRIELLSMAGLVDAAWAMSRGYKKEDFWGYFWGQAIAIYILWMAGTIVGVLAPIPDHPLIDAAFAATPVVFFSLMITLIWRNGINKLPHVASALLTILCAKVLGLPDTAAALLGATVAGVGFTMLTPLEKPTRDNRGDAS